MGFLVGSGDDRDYAVPASRRVTDESVTSVSNVERAYLKRPIEAHPATSLPEDPSRRVDNTWCIDKTWEEESVTWCGRSGKFLGQVLNESEATETTRLLCSKCADMASRAIEDRAATD